MTGRAILRSLLAPLLLALLAGPAPAQTPSPNPVEIEKLLTTLEDPAAREAFIRQLRGLVEAQRATAPPPAAPIPDRVASRLLETLSDRVAEAGESVFRAAEAIADTPQLFIWLWRQLDDGPNRARLLEIFVTLVLVLGIAWIVERATMLVLARPRKWIETRATDDGWAHLPYVVLDALIAAAPIVVFAAVAFGVLTLGTPIRAARLAALALVNAHILARLVGLISGIVLAPRARGLRLLPLGDETAAYLDLWIRRLAMLSIYGYFAAEAALPAGLPLAGHRVLLKLLGLLVALLLLVLILQNRGAVAAFLAGSGDVAPLRSVRRLVAANWHLAAILYVLVVLSMWLAHADAGFVYIVRATASTALAVALAVVLRRLAHRVLARLFRVTDEMRSRLPGLEARANRYLQVFNVGATVVIVGLAALAVLQAWGLASFGWFETPTGRRVRTSALSIGATLLVAIAIWEGVNALLERYAASAFGTGWSRGRARFGTLVTLAQRVLIGVLALFVGLVVLSEAGINIAPLLAGAGVIGLAVGLGAQTLVKNMIEGVSNMVEDSFTVGDIVQIGDKSGVVETITMRMVRLRDYAGHVHTVPFSEIKTVTNMTRDFAFAVFDIGVGYGEDVDKVIGVLKQEAAALRADPAFGRAIADDLDVAGVDKFADSAIVIKLRFKVAPPLEQWNVQREFNRRIKQAFDREGIEMPYPQRTVHMAGDANRHP
jgi:small conductance mechanosensitive channel